MEFGDVLLVMSPEQAAEQLLSSCLFDGFAWSALREEGMLQGEAIIEAASELLKKPGGRSKLGRGWWWWSLSGTCTPSPGENVALTGRDWSIPQASSSSLQQAAAVLC